MAHTAHSNPERLEEHFDSDETLARKVSEVAALVRRARRIMFNTGAGISRALPPGITERSSWHNPHNLMVADYRSKDTGVWTRAAEGNHAAAGIQMHQAVPNLNHLGIAAFHALATEAGGGAAADAGDPGKEVVTVSTNVDGLHVESGIPLGQLVELHGNGLLEECVDCSKLHYRRCRVAGGQRHFTGRLCCACSEPLRDNIINFGEPLRPDYLERAFNEARTADLQIILGTSLAVAPANALPSETKRNGGSVVLVNLQTVAPAIEATMDVRVYARAELFMELLLRELNMPAPAYTVRHQITLERDAAAGTVRFCAMLPGSDIPASPFASIARVDARGAVVDNKNFTLDVSALNDICPTFRNVEPAGGEVHFVCQRFFDDRLEPGPVRLTLPEGVEAATFHVSWRWDPRATEPGVDELSDIGEWEVDCVTVPGGVARVNLGRGNGAVAAQVTGLKDSAGNSYDGYFAVQPLPSCPHLAAVGPTEGQQITLGATCSAAGCSRTENWLCLQAGCGAVLCARAPYGANHFQEHALAEGHHVALSLADLSVWCNRCATYVLESNPAVAPMHRALYAARFGNEELTLLDTANAAAQAVNAGTGAAAAATEDAAAEANNNNDSNAQQDERTEQQAATDALTHAHRAGGAGAQVPGGGFAVEPLATCAHCSLCPLPAAGEAMPSINTPCSVDGCGNVGENMICLVCKKVFCGRYVRAHAVQHVEQEHNGVAICLGFADLSCWCYACDSFINQKALAGLVAPVYFEKFGEDDPELRAEARRAAAAAGGGASSAGGARPDAAPGVDCDHMFASTCSAANCDGASLTARIAALRAGTLRCDVPGCAAPAGTGDTLLCLGCGAAFCSRNRFGHAADHAAQSGHSCVIDAAQRVLCYACDDSRVSGRQAFRVLRTKQVNI